MSPDRPDFEAQEAGYMTISWLRAAKEEIDRLLGEGYAKKNPELLGMFIQAASIKYYASVLNANDDFISIAASLDSLADSISRSDWNGDHS